MDKLERSFSDNRHHDPLSLLMFDRSISDVSGRPPISDLKSAVRRLTSRAALIRQSSAALLRRDTTPTLLRKTSAINLFPELDDSSLGPGIELYYYSGWDSPNLHFRTDDSSQWTTPPGISMRKLDILAKTVACLPAFPPLSLDSESIWAATIPGIIKLEFVPNNKGLQWDKAPGNSNYFAAQPGRYMLRNGKLQQLLDPPKKPALLKATQVGTTHVCLVWNPPVIEPALVAAYRVYRDGKVVCDLGESVHMFKDDSLLGLTKYIYLVKAVNELGTEGPPSDSVTVETGEPGKPSSPQDVRVTAHSKVGIEIQWHPPADHGGSPIQSYNVYRNGKLHAHVPATTGICEHYHDNVNVKEDHFHMYHISALNQPLAHEFKRLSEVSPVPDVVISPDAISPQPLTDPTGTAGTGAETGARKVSELTFEERSVMYRGESVKMQTHSEGLLSEPVEAKAITMLVLPRIHDGKTHIILQAFNWVSCKNRDGWYTVLQSKLDAMKESQFSMIWLPPPALSVSDDGYMPTKWYNLNTKYGTKEELVELTSEMRNMGLVPMMDLVVNHRCGTKQDEKGQWTIYEDPDWGNWAIVTNNVQGYSASGGQDTGTQSDCAPDIDHTNTKVRQDVKKWTKWMFEEIGFGSVRIDMAPGYSVGYQVEYIENLGSPFTVGEYWNGDPKSLQNYTSGAKGRIAAFDFALYYVLRRCTENNDFSDMRDGNRLQGLVGRDPERAVTFLDNHDTEHLSFVGKFGNGSGDVILRGYCFILTHPGTPSVYWNHFSDYGDYMRNTIAQLGTLRKDAGVTSTSGVHIDVAQWGLYAAYISRERHCGRGGGHLAVKVGSRSWRPDGDWQKKIEGNGFCVWQRK